MSDRKYKNPQVNLRLPVEIKERLIELAEANSRSLNAEHLKHGPKKINTFKH
jgi:predicted DNA-binding protein